MSNTTDNAIAQGFADLQKYFGDEIKSYTNGNVEIAGVMIEADRIEDAILDCDGLAELLDWITEQTDSIWMERR